MNMRERCEACGRPEVIKAAHGWSSLFWLANIPPFTASYFLLERELFVGLSLLYLGIVSIWANFATHATGWVAGRVEVRQDEAT